jgi:hypothetical protein
VMIKLHAEITQNDEGASSSRSIYRNGRKDHI